MNTEMSVIGEQNLTFSVSKVYFNAIKEMFQHVYLFFREGLFRLSYLSANPPAVRPDMTIGS